MGRGPETPVVVPVGRDRMAFEVVTREGRAAEVGVVALQDVVEIWLSGHRRGTVERLVLRAWLAAKPREPLAVDELAFSMDRMLDSDGRIAISFPDHGVLVWALAPNDQEQLVRIV